MDQLNKKLSDEETEFSNLYEKLKEADYSLEVKDADIKRLKTHCRNLDKWKRELDHELDPILNDLSDVRQLKDENHQFKQKINDLEVELQKANQIENQLRKQLKQADEVISYDMFTYDKGTEKLR